MGEMTTTQLRDPAFRHRDYRLTRLRQVLSGWQKRQVEIEGLVMDSFQAQDLEKIAVLLTEKKWLERRIIGLNDFVDAFTQ